MKVKNCEHILKTIANYQEGSFASTCFKIEYCTICGLIIKTTKDNISGNTIHVEYFKHKEE